MTFQFIYDFSWNIRLRVLFSDSGARFGERSESVFAGGKVRDRYIRAAGISAVVAESIYRTCNLR